ncbi:MAG: neutral zinc metallopeptidase, partial [Burkholderiales bacterium]|nr:neutral zinc metallopeptidase [Burkholderiales bacterium]
MRWDDLRTSQNVEDRRGDGGGGGGNRTGFGLGGGGGRLGIGTIIVLGIIGWALGINPAVLIGGAEMMTGGGQPAPRYQEAQPRSTTPPDDQVGLFVAKILGETEDVWSQVLPQQVNRRYEPPHLVLFSGYTTSQCGPAQAATGPFYCPLDRKVYLDTSFFKEMQQRFGGGGEFAYA